MADGEIRMATMPRSRAEQLLEQMTLAQKVGQVFVFTFVSQEQALQDLALHPGGYVRIYSDALTVARQNAELQERSELPLFLSADFERGIGSTVGGAIDFATQMCLGATGNEEFSYRAARVIAEEALAMGINMNYVPVLDVNVNEANPIINTRSFGEDPELVAKLGAAFIRGTQDSGVAACGKHFPGHGDTSVDSHTNLGSIDVDRQRLEAVELVPFRKAIETGVDAIMSAHLLIPAYEPEPIPATLSRRIMTGLLREELGFDGVAVSDALEMGGIAKHFRAEEAIVRAVNAGVDQLIMPLDNGRAVRTLLNAVESGQVTEERLNEAVLRILALKVRRGILDREPLNLSRISTELNTPAHQREALEANLAGVTLVKNSGEVLPLKPSQSAAFISFSNFEDSRTYFLEPKTAGNHLASEGITIHNVNCGMLDERAVHEFNVVDKAIQAAREADVIILGAYVKVVINRGSVGLEERYTRFVKSLIDMKKPIVLVSFGSPYLLKQFPDVDAYVCGYGATEATQKATAMLLAGKAEFRGKLPVTLSI